MITLLKQISHTNTSQIIWFKCTSAPNDLTSQLAPNITNGTNTQALVSL